MDQRSTSSVPDPRQGKAAGIQPAPAQAATETAGAQPPAAAPPGGGTAAPVSGASPAPPPPPVHVSLDIDPAEIGGRTDIGEQAVARVASIAARSVAGVYALGSGTSRALGAVREAVGGSGGAQGVQAEVGEAEAAIDVTLVATYGYPLITVANEVRASVYAAVEQLVGLNVVEVNVTVADVHVPDPETRPARPAGATAAGTDG